MDSILHVVNAALEVGLDGLEKVAHCLAAFWVLEGLEGAPAATK